MFRRKFLALLLGTPLIRAIPASKIPSVLSTKVNLDGGCLPEGHLLSLEHAKRVIRQLAATGYRPYELNGQRLFPMWSQNGNLTAQAICYWILSTPDGDYCTGLRFQAKDFKQAAMLLEV